MPRAKRRIALLTDFGTRDPYVAVMKGVIAERTDVPVFDLTHEIAPFEVFEAAWFLRSVAPWWPEGTIFVAVVDPGVGTKRRILAAEREGRILLAPDNGLLSMVINGGAVSVESASLFLPVESRTFHGRDRFAPVAAALANGFPVAKLGPAVTDLVRLEYVPPSYGPDRVTGTIVVVDRFGNLITDIEVAHIGFEPFTLRAGEVKIARVERTYQEAAAGPFLITGSTGCIEISIGSASAAERLGLRRGNRVEVTRSR